MAACSPLGNAVVRHFAAAGSRVIAVDSDQAALDLLSAEFPSLVEPLGVPDSKPEVFKCLEAVWEDHPVGLVINLMPLSNPMQTTTQVKWLGILFRTLLRGLAAGQGSLVSVATRPTQPLSLHALGTYAALRESSAALGRSVAKAHVKVHSISVPQNAQMSALSTLAYLGRAEATHLNSTAFELD